MAEQGMRLDRLLAASGYGSRNDVKKLIRNGLVSVDGITVRNADLKVRPDTQEIRVDDQPVVYEKYHYFML
ncbi:MAG: 16S rRNA pseudouridine(516) synthase, partial [Solobacterium sp.]|nr:16S rRNA pseudouridine(516) synthase [Solobacterium sp.]